MNKPLYQILFVDSLASNYKLLKNLLKQVKTFDFTLEWLLEFELELLCCSEKYYDVYLISSPLEKAIYWAKKVAPIPVIFIAADVDEGVKALENGISDYLIEGGLNTYVVERSLRLSMDLFYTKVKLKKYQFNYRLQLEQQLERQTMVLKKHQSSSFKNQILKANKQQYVTLTEAVQVGLYHNDKEGNCIYINQKCCEIIGITLKECLGKGWVERLHPDDRERVWGSWDEAFQTKSPWQSEYRFIQPDGTVVWVYGQTVFVFNEEGESICSVGSLTDVTQRKSLEEALSESEAFFRDIANNIPSAIFFIE